jgi:hypothetical protein
VSLEDECVDEWDEVLTDEGVVEVVLHALLLHDTGEQVSLPNESVR